MPTPSSQGSSVTFNGVPLGRVTNWRASPGSASYVEKTHVGSQILGSGANSRIVREYDCVSVEPGSVDVTLFGCPPYAAADTGLKATLIVSFDGGSLTAEAFLDTFEVTAQVGQFLVGRANFRFTGA